MCTTYFLGVKGIKISKKMLRLATFFKPIKVNRVWISTSNYTKKRFLDWKSRAKEGGLNAHEEWRWQTVTAHAEIFFVETWYSLDNLHDTPTFFLGLTSCQWNDPCTMGLISLQRHFLLSFFYWRLAGLWSLPNTICWADKHLKDQKRSQKCWW